MIGLIAAYTKNRVIGNQGCIPWKIKGEQQRFKKLTTGHTIIMGRRSFEEIGRPLPNRKTILISNTMKYEGDHCITVSSLKKALEAAGDDEIYISGGAMVYREALPYVDKMFITVIHKEIEGDTYFPLFHEEDFQITYEEHVEGEIPYTYYTYERKQGKMD